MCVCVFVCVCLQLSEEELSQLQKESWENPVFDNLDQLMDERYIHPHECFLACIMFVIVSSLA